MEQQAVALQAAACHPGIQQIATAAGFTGEATVNSFIGQATAVEQRSEFSGLQMEKMVRRAVATKEPKGRPNNDGASFVESLLTSIAESPDSSLSPQQTRKAPTMRAQALALGLPWTTGRTMLKNAKAKRGLLKRMEAGVN